MINNDDELKENNIGLLPMDYECAYFNNYICSYTHEKCCGHCGNNCYDMRMYDESFI